MTESVDSQRSFLARAFTWTLIVCFSVTTSPRLFGAPPMDERKWAELRAKMVKEEIVDAGIRDPRVQAAIRDTPRHHFVLESHRKYSYYDMALPIGSGQTISPPFVVAYMTEQLRPEPKDKVLEIGTGSGYQAAVLSPLVAEVYSIEIVEELGKNAAEVLKKLKYANVHTKVADGYQGWAEHAPFDKIIVTCSPENIPPKLIEQLREGGLMVIPLGERYQQTLYRAKKVNGKMEAEILEPTFFVPMTGKAEDLREKKNDTGIPELLNGSFESVSPQGIPTGWYYVRQAALIDDSRADGTRMLRFSNMTPGHGAQALQSLAMDGRKVKELEISLWVEAKNVHITGKNDPPPHLELSFFDDIRAPCGTVTIGKWQGNIPGGKRTQKVKVPGKARLAVLAVGLFGSTGELTIDNVAIRVMNE